ncbi:MAG: hypothetical protein OXU94_08890 [Gammaproteobacteria bacterium]|nr:hypothetical protein [Gammaproteobacteria bacterium]
MSHTSHCILRGRHFSVRRIAFAALFTVLLAPPAMGGELSIIADTSDPGRCAMSSAALRPPTRM